MKKTTESVPPTDSVPTPVYDPGTAQRFRKALRDWYLRHGRNLPWRMTSDPYHIWISEIMLQQTTVVAVVPYFERFLTRFPTIHELAAAEEAEVLRHWEGLGYYSRARNIHKAAKHVSSALQGIFPKSVDGLQELPGIGRYTAGAIRSFAFDLPAPIVEANTLRLYCRLLGYDGDPRSREGQNRLWSFAEEIVPTHQPGRFNQALMELGAVVCTPANPKCAECPVSFACQAYATNRQAEIPRPAVRPVITPVTELSAIVSKDGKYLVYHRAPGERWAGLWDFPRFPLDDALVKSLKKHPASLEQTLTEKLGITVTARELLTEICHSVTRYRITLRAFHCDHVAGEIAESVGHYRWLTVEEVHALPLSVTGRKLAKLL